LSAKTSPSVHYAAAHSDIRPCDFLTAGGIPLQSAFEMANKAEKWKDNAGGKFYVDQQCIDCDLCRETAPAFFKRHEEGGYSFVHTQPATEEDVQLCMEALEGCPVEAIGNDGEE
jgi:ferredoxin